MSVKIIYPHLLLPVETKMAKSCLREESISNLSVFNKRGQLRGALQNRGRKHGETFTSTQKEDLFPVGKLHQFPLLLHNSGFTEAFKQIQLVYLFVKK